MSSPARPVLRYHGGKWMLAPWIIRHFPPHRNYVEPFAGGASVLMRKPRSFQEVYNDLDENVVNVFRVLRDRAAALELVRLLELTPWSRVEFFASYEATEDPVERARRTIVRCFQARGSTSRRKNRTGFRAHVGRNRSQTGASDWRNYPEHIPTFVRRLQGVVIECRPALEVIAQQDGPDTLIYADPPYPTEVRSTVRRDCASDRDRAYAHDLDEAQHRELAEVLRGAASAVVVSGYACPLYDGDLYSDWQRVQRSTTTDGAVRRTECLWLNERATRGIQGHLFPARLA